MICFVAIQVAYTYVICLLRKSLKKFEAEKTFDNEISSIKVQSYGFYFGSLLYFCFFVIVFAIATFNEITYG